MLIDRPDAVRPFQSRRRGFTGESLRAAGCGLRGLRASGFGLRAARASGCAGCGTGIYYGTSTRTTYMHTVDRATQSGTYSKVGRARSIHTEGHANVSTQAVTINATHRIRQVLAPQTSAEARKPAMRPETAAQSLPPKPCRKRSSTLIPLLSSTDAGLTRRRSRWPAHRLRRWTWRTPACAAPAASPGSQSLAGSGRPAASRTGPCPNRRASARRPTNVDSARRGGHGRRKCK